MPGFWDRLRLRRRAAELEREAEESQMSADERRFVHESVDERQADAFVDGHLGGTDPNRLIEDDEPPS